MSSCKADDANVVHPKYFISGEHSTLHHMERCPMEEMKCVTNYRFERKQFFYELLNSDLQCDVIIGNNVSSRLRILLHNLPLQISNSDIS